MSVNMDARHQALEYCFPSHQEYIDSIYEGAQLISERTGLSQHDMLVVLGSGLKDALDDCGQVRATIALDELPDVPRPAAEGHGAELISLDIPVRDSQVVHALVATGRSHLYEGYTTRQICQLVRIAAMTGIRAAVMTNANGCLYDWNLGDIMVIRDHINFSGASPFDGATFVDIAHVWDEQLSDVLATYAQREGVYALMRGPEFQTMAESHMLKNCGVHTVGMSTIMEAIALHQLTVPVCGISVVADLSFAQTPCTHHEVLQAMNRATGQVARAIQAVATHI